MAAGTSGLQRDLILIRRRVWLFIPFFFLGILAALAFNVVAGETTGIAEMELDTVVHDAGGGIDRGLRIFEAQSMTSDAEFQAMVIEEIGDPEFDYERFEIKLRPLSVAAGISRGTLTVTISDRSRKKAERYRDAFVEVFTREYLEPGGLWRMRFIRARETAATAADRAFREGYANLAAATAGLDLPIDQLIRVEPQRHPQDALAEQEAEVRRALLQAEGALAAITGLQPAAAAAVVAGVLGQPVAEADAETALRAHIEALRSALEGIQERSRALSTAGLGPELTALIAEVRALNEARTEAALLLAEARVAIQVSESNIEVEEDLTGGLGGTIIGQVAVVLAVTIVFGLIAIYTVEWLSQVRSRIATG
ncbi:MAG: hypothetical protein Kow0010_25270 [Dehalococcoidia bacterium]